MSTLRAALAELADEFARRADAADLRALSDRYADVRRLCWEAAEQKVRALLAAHPAPEAGEVRLSETESAWVTKLWDPRGRRGRLAEEKFALEQIIEARLAQPAGEVRVEWGVRYGDGDVEEFSSRESVGRELARVRRFIASNEVEAEDYEPMTAVSRTVTSFPEVVGEWEVASDE